MARKGIRCSHPHPALCSARASTSAASLLATWFALTGGSLRMVAPRKPSLVPWVGLGSAAGALPLQSHGMVSPGKIKVIWEHLHRQKKKQGLDRWFGTWRFGTCRLKLPQQICKLWEEPCDAPISEQPQVLCSAFCSKQAAVLKHWAFLIALHSQNAGQVLGSRL